MYLGIKNTIGLILWRIRAPEWTVKSSIILLLMEQDGIIKNIINKRKGKIRPDEFIIREIA